MSWHHLIGTLAHQAGNAPATATLPTGASLILLIAHATSGNGTVTIFDGPTITVISGAQPLYIQNYHDLHQAKTGNAGIVFGTNVDMWYVQYVKSGNVP